MKAKVVIGSAFGDEGKGLFTDYFSYNNPNSLVIRHSGGSQAGHSVKTPNGIRHVFSHFGSGSLNGTPTYLSKFFIVNPLMFKKELTKLQEKSIIPILVVDSRCIVTTPYDMIINQIVENARGDSRHGSCGVGINETIKRNEVFPISVIDLLNSSKLKETLIRIRKEYLFLRLSQLGVTIVPKEFLKIIESEKLLDNFIYDCSKFLEFITYDKPNFTDYDNLVFEGSQGLMLDQNSKHFPYVTPSNTGVKNVLEIIEEEKIVLEDIETVYLTRAYTTRHGAGNLPFETVGKTYAKIEDKTNIPNDFQGSLRFSPLNLDELIDSIYEDSKLLNKISIGITCVDQVDDEEKIVCILDNVIQYFSLSQIQTAFCMFMKKISMFYTSRGETRNTITKGGE